MKKEFQAETCKLVSAQLLLNPIILDKSLNLPHTPLCSSIKQGTVHMGIEITAVKVKTFYEYFVNGL